MATTKVTSGGITDATIATADIADNAVTENKVLNGAVTSAKLGASAVGETKLATDAVTTVKIAGGAVTEPKLAANSINTAKIVDQAVTLAKLPHGTSSNNGKFLRANNGADPTFETVSPQLGGDLQSNGNDIDLADGDKITFGNSGDLQIEHDGGHSYIQDVGTGDLNINSSRVRLKSADNSEIMLQATANGGVEAYHNNVEMIETFDTGDVGDSASNVGSGVKTIGNTGAGTRSNHGYYCYQGSNLVARLTNHGSGPEGAFTLYNQGVPKISMNGTNGTLRLHGSAGYIQFGDTSSDSHRLDDYEEGTWSPGINQGTANFGNAKYTKIGRFVNATVFVSGMSPRTSTQGIQITGLPFQANGIFVAPLGLHRIIGDQGNGQFGYVSDNTTYIDLIQYPWSQQGWKHLPHTAIQHATAAYIIITLSYQTD